MSFLSRVESLPVLGIGVSTEYGALQTEGALDILDLQNRYPHYAQFLEVGVEVEKGLDELGHQWLARSLPTTYHFLDINLDQPDDQEPRWIQNMQYIAHTLKAQWLCGDAGLWHYGARDRGQMLLLPPLLTAASARAQARGIQTLRDAVQLEVFPENPPGTAFIGDLHLLDYFAEMIREADTGMLLDCAHLAIYQRLMNYPPLMALDRFPLEHIVELHIAGGVVKKLNGFEWVEDLHGTAPLPDTLEIVNYVLSRCPNLKAIVFECERNTLASCLPTFEWIHRHRPAHFNPPVSPASSPSPALQPIPPRSLPPSPPAPFPADPSTLQIAVVGLHHDGALRRRWVDRPESVFPHLSPAEVHLLKQVDIRAFEVDPEAPWRRLTHLIEEYPATMLAFQAPPKTGLNFFSSPQFHQSLWPGGRMVLAFGDWVQTWAPPVARVLALLEQGIAAARRYIPSLPPGDCLALAPQTRPLSLPEQTLQLYALLMQQIAATGQSPIEVVVHQQIPLPKLPRPHPKKREYALIAPDPEGSLGIGGCSAALGSLLSLLIPGPLPFSTLKSYLQKQGVEPEEIQELIQGWVEEGLLIRGF